MINSHHTTHRIVKLLRSCPTPLTASEISKAIGTPVRAVRRALVTKRVTSEVEYRRTRLPMNPHVYWGRGRPWETVTSIPLVGVTQAPLTPRLASPGQQRGSNAGGEAMQDKLLFEGRDRYPTNKPTLEDRHRPFTFRESERLERWAVT